MASKTRLRGHMNPGQLITHFNNAHGRGGQTKIGAYFTGYDGRHSPLSLRPGESGLVTRGLKCASSLFMVRWLPGGQDIPADRGFIQKINTLGHSATPVFGRFLR